MALRTKSPNSRAPLAMDALEGPFADLAVPGEVEVLAAGTTQTVALTRKLGQGGQGAVFATQNSRVVLKLCATRDAAHDEQLTRQLDRLQRLGLEDLPIALPEVTVSAPALGAVGYLAPWLEDMVSLESWLKWPRGGEPLEPWYGATGGLRRRLRILARLARVLAALHARGACYVDVSPGNVFMSSDPEHEQVWLIDADNIRYVSSAQDAVYTPRYGAPEIVQGRSGATTLSDVFSFGVMAFETLTLCHPFIGDEVNDGEPEMEEVALRGELPWIDDPDDDCNATDLGFPREILLTKRLRKVAERTFGAGRTEPTQRASMEAWADALSHAADRCVTCTKQDCGHSFLVTLEACPFCDTARRPDVIRVDLRLWRSDEDDDLAGVVGERLRTWVFSADSPLSIPASELLGRRRWLTMEPQLQLTRTARGVRVTGDDSLKAVVVRPESSKPAKNGKRLGAGRVIDRGWRVHLRPDLAVHRVLTITFARRS